MLYSIQIPQYNTVNIVMSYIVFYSIQTPQYIILLYNTVIYSFTGGSNIET